LDQEELDRFLEQEGTEWKRTPGTTGAEEIIEFAGRICYMSFGNKQSPKLNREYVQNLIQQEHDSVLEHASWTFLLTGVSRAFTHQMVRHRVGFSFSQLSQQYHDETAAKFVIPEEIKMTPKARDLWLGLIDELRKGYQSISNDLEKENLRSQTTPKESRRSIRSAARSILPNATETKLVFSANGRALRHFLNVRGTILGDLEMRRVSALIYSRLMNEAPALLSGFEMNSHEDGYPLIRRKHT
jgi:thymidylate synthase (FAD)